LEPQVVLTVPLLVGLDGADKMSKSLGNAIAVEDTPKEMYGKTMSIPDGLMWDWYLLLTNLPEAEIANRREAIVAGTRHPKETKSQLARSLVAQYHGEQAAQEAAAEFDRIFAGGGVPDEVEEREIAGGPKPLRAILVESGAAPSSNEAVRLVRQGAV